MTLSKREITRYARQTILPEIGNEGQEKLKAASVLIVGAGGLGSPLLQYLAGAGIGRIVVVDHDKIDVSNLHRQVLYNETEVDQSKALTAKNKLNALNPDITIEAHEIHLNASNIEAFIQDVDLVIDSSDNFETRYLVNDACVLNKRILVYGAVNKLEGQVSVFNAPLDSGKRSAHYRDLFPEMPDDGIVQNCAEAGVLGPVVGIIGSMMATEAIKIITGTGQALIGRMVYVDCLTMAFREVRFNHESSYVVKELPDVMSFCVTEYRIIDWQNLDKNRHFLVDVRQPSEKQEFDAGGLLIPLDALKNRFHELPSDKAIVFYCKTGLRSDQAVQMMAQLSDRKDVYSIKGGIFSLSIV